MSTKKNVLWFGAVFILVLSVVTFVWIPTAGKSIHASTPVFGKWNGKAIEYAQDSFFIRQLQAITEQVRSQGQEVNDYNYFQIMQAAFNSTAIRLGILDELNGVGYKVSTDAVNKNLIKYYQDENGKYSAKIYSETPETTRESRRSVMTEELTAQRYTEDYFGNSQGVYGLKTSTKETDMVKSMSSPERSFTYVSFATSAYPQTEIVAWAQANSKLFVKHNLSAIMFDTEAAAKKVAAALAKKPAGFDEAVTTYSTRVGTDTTGKITESFRSDLNKLFTDAKDLDTVLALKPNEISPIVKVGKTFAIVRCNAAPTDPDFANPTTLAAITAYMNTNEKGKIEDYFSAQAKEFAELARTKGFDAACKAKNLTKKTTTAFGINYGNANIMMPVPADKNPELAAAVKSETFFKTAFSLQTGAISDPVILGNNVVVLQVAEEKAADPQILEMVPLYYNYYAANWSQGSLANNFLKSKKLENNFMATYLKYFLK
jgi:PPIC-type PPIASE domain.